MSKETPEKRDFSLEPVDRNRLANLVGAEDENLRQIAKRLGVEIAYSGAHFHIEGSNKGITTAERIIKQLYLETAPLGKKKKAAYITPDMVNLTIIEFSRLEAHSSVDKDKKNNDKGSSKGTDRDRSNSSGEVKVLGKKHRPSKKELAELVGDEVIDENDYERGSVGALYHDAATLKTQRGVVKPRTENQAHYISQILSHDVNFGIGPAGTGKTFLAVAAAVDALTRNEVRRIILTRPAVEAGEKLGFLPGDLSQKVDPYLRPLYDALFEMLGFEKVEKLIERQVIEIAPLAYMRGRTLNDSFIILDEAQNTTTEQMKMFLTRIGFNSKAVITGDPSQVDLPRNVRSGLRHAIEVLSEVKSISFTYFIAEDVVRHPVVAEIVNAYDAFERRHAHEEGNERDEYGFPIRPPRTRRFKDEVSEDKLQDALANVEAYDAALDSLAEEGVDTPESNHAVANSISDSDGVIGRNEVNATTTKAAAHYASNIKKDVERLDHEHHMVEKAFLTADQFDEIADDMLDPKHNNSVLDQSTEFNQAAADILSDKNQE